MSRPPQPEKSEVILIRERCRWCDHRSVLRIKEQGCQQWCLQQLRNDGGCDRSSTCMSSGGKFDCDHLRFLVRRSICRVCGIVCAPSHRAVGLQTCHLFAPRGMSGLAHAHSNQPQPDGQEGAADSAAVGPQLQAATDVSAAGNAANAAQRPSESEGGASVGGGLIPQVRRRLPLPTDTDIRRITHVKHSGSLQTVQPVVGEFVPPAAGDMAGFQGETSGGCWHGLCLQVERCRCQICSLVSELSS
jgi:hypothetical protein